MHKISFARLSQTCEAVGLETTLGLTAHILFWNANFIKKQIYFSLNKLLNVRCRKRWKEKLK
jgi:hypothetical protein